MRDGDHVVIGRRDFSGGEQPCRLNVADRRQHLYLVGKTGVGKSTLIRNLIVQDIEAGRGVGLIDPHGDLSQEILDHIPPRRFREVVYFNPSDLARPVGFNLLGRVPSDSRHLIASGVVEAFRNIWADSWGPRLEYLLYNCLAALLDYGESSILGVPKLLTDASFRRRVIDRIDDPMVKRFFIEEFGRMTGSLLQETIAPLQNKAGRVLASAPLRNILGQVKSSIDLGFTMDNRRVFIANLGKGSLGADKANLIGSLLLTSFQLAAMRRAELPEGSRVDFTLYVDEFHNFTTESFATILSEARKYRLSLVLAHQYLDQLSEPMRQAVFGNVGSLIVFRVGQADAEILARELEHEFSPDDLTTLGRGEVRVRMIRDGLPVTPFRAATATAVGRRFGKGDLLRRVSRERFGRAREAVEQRIGRFLEGRRTVQQ